MFLLNIYIYRRPLAIVVEDVEFLDLISTRYQAGDKENLHHDFLAELLTLRLQLPK